MRRKVGPLGLAVALGRGGWSVRRQWQKLPVDRRARLLSLARKSGARPGSLSSAEREELGALLRELQVGMLLRQAVMDATFTRRGYRRF